MFPPPLDKPVNAIVCVLALVPLILNPAPDDNTSPSPVPLPLDVITTWKSSLSAPFFHSNPAPAFADASPLPLTVVVTLIL